MDEREQIQEAYVIQFFKEMETDKDVCTSEEVFYISHNHKPNQFLTRLECANFIKRLIEEEKINGERVSFD